MVQSHCKLLIIGKCFYLYVGVNTSSSLFPISTSHHITLISSMFHLIQPFFRRPHQMASLPGTQTAPPTAATALIQPSSSEDTSTTLPASTASQQQQHQQQATAATIIATASPPATSSTTTLVEVPSSSEELVLHRGVRLVTAYFHSQNEPPPLNILSTANIKQDDVPTGIVAAAAAAIGGRLQQSVMDQGRGVGFQPTLVIRQQEPRAAAVSPPTEQVQLTTVSEVVSLPPLQLISTNNL